MKLKRLIASAFAAAAVVASFAAPMAYADDSMTSGGTVNEAGDLSFHLWNNAISFSPASVTTSASQVVGMAGADHTVLQVDDTHSYNELGYDLNVSATNLNSGAYFIEASNLSVRSNGMFRIGIGNCLALPNPKPVVGGNAYQTVTRDLATTFTSLAAPVDVMSATAGRGCGPNGGINLYFQLNVPAGTYTGGGAAVYAGTITVTNTLAPSAD